MKTLLLTLLTVFTLAFANAQAKWELGGQVGVMGYQGDLNPNKYMDFNTLKLDYGLFLKRNFSKTIGLKLNYLGGQVAGDDTKWNAERKTRALKAKTSVNELSLLLDWDILGKSRYREDGTFRKRFSPYLFAGVGAAFVGLPEVNYGHPNTPGGDPDYPNRPNLAGIAKDQAATKPSVDFTVPFGAGVRIDLSRQWVLGAEYGLRPVFDDYLDGIKEGGNNTDDDWYSSLGLNLSYRFGQKDTDKDGIIDKKDACPLVPGLAQFNGCPDTDGDGIPDKDDKCPTIAGTKANNGCPEMKQEVVQAINLAVKNIQFETNSDVLRAESVPVVTQLAEILAQYPNYNVNISGHTDSDGNDKANLMLSEKRANKCVEFLTSKGIAASRLTAKGYGETKPIATNKTKAGKQANRRVEFELVKTN